MLRLLLAVGLLAGCGCRSIEVTTQRNERLNFSVYRTYNWLPETGEPTGDPRLDDPAWGTAIVEAANLAFRNKGLRLERTNAPHLWVTYRLSIKRKARVDDSFLGSERTESGGGKEYYSGRSMGDQSRRVEEYEIGTLTIDVNEAAGMELIWRGVAKAEIDASASPSRKISRIQTATREVIGEFPRR